MRSNITVINSNKRRRIDEKRVKKAVVDILKILKKPSDTKLEIAFLSNRLIRPINKYYKGHDRATDVLSFDLGSCAQVLISSDMALENSKKFKTSFEKELLLYVIHGILHLCGYDDGTRKEKSRMFRKQDSIMETLCARPTSQKVSTRR